MNKLEIARQQINEADREIAKYFEKRMKASQMVAEYKLENMMPIFDPKREAQVIENNKAFIDDPRRKYKTKINLQKLPGPQKRFQKTKMKTQAPLQLRTLSACSSLSAA